MKVYDALAEVFSREQTNTCFALLGDANMNWATALASRECDFVYVRDEHCAVAAAMSYSRKKDSVGVATVTCGPGVTQILTALPAAVRAKIPLVIFAGEAPLKSSWYNQGIDQAPLIEACGARYTPLHDVSTMLTQIRHAFSEARADRCPIVLGVPMDMQNEEWSGDVDYPRNTQTNSLLASTLAPVPEDFLRAVEWIAQSERIIVMAGLGAAESGAGPACVQLADRLKALLATTLPARGLFYQDPFSIGVAGGFSTELARECFARADLVIAVGTRLARHNTDNGKLYQGKNTLHIDIETQDQEQCTEPAAQFIHADAKLAVDALLSALPAGSRESPDWRCDDIARQIRERPADAAQFAIESDLLDPRWVIQALDAVLPQQWEVVNSSGHCSYFAAQMPRRPQQHFFTLREFGAIGNGIGFAVGVAAARPSTPVVLIDGEGSLLMHIQELETIQRHQMPVLICVLNDGAYGSEIHKLRAEGMSDAGAVFGRPDFAEIAKGFGITAHRVTVLDQLEPLMQSFTESGKAQLWDFHVSDKVVSPVVRRSHH